MLTLLIILKCFSFSFLIKVCRSFRNASSEYCVWLQRLYDLQLRCSDLVLDDHVDLTALCTQHLKIVVLRTHKLERLWSGQAPRRKCLRKKHVKASVLLLQPFFRWSHFSSLDASYISEREIIGPISGGGLTLFDIRKKLRSDIKADEITMLGDTVTDIVIRIDHSSRTLCGLVHGTYTDRDNDFASRWARRCTTAYLHILLPDPLLRSSVRSYCPIQT